MKTKNISLNYTGTCKTGEKKCTEMKLIWPGEALWSLGHCIETDSGGSWRETVRQTETPIRHLKYKATRKSVETDEVKIQAKQTRDCEDKTGRDCEDKTRRDCQDKTRRDCEDKTRQQSTIEDEKGKRSQALPGNMVEPPDNRVLLYRSRRMSMSHFSMLLCSISCMPACSRPETTKSNHIQGWVLLAYSISCCGNSVERTNEIAYRTWNPALSYEVLKTESDSFTGPL